MLKYVGVDVVFAEVPGEVSLAVVLSGCPNRCAGCHSPWLWAQEGEVLDERALGALLDRYGSAVTCVCFMGGDADPQAVARLARWVKQKNTRLKTAWYSGCEQVFVEPFDYIKVGPYVAHLGGLDSPTTNQRFYRVANGRLDDQTAGFRRRV